MDLRIWILGLRFSEEMDEGEQGRREEARGDLQRAMDL